MHRRDPASSFFLGGEEEEEEEEEEGVAWVNQVHGSLPEWNDDPCTHQREGYMCVWGFEIGGEEGR